MNILLIIVLIIVVLIALVLIAASLTEVEFTIEQDIVINKPKQEVFNFIKKLENQVYYNKWVMMDPNAKRTNSGTDGTIGFVTAWESENKQVGKGEQEVKQLIDGERIDTEIRFKEPMESKAYTHMLTESVAGNQTKVRWVFTGVRNYKMRVMYLLLNIKAMLGNSFKESLTNLKTVLEK